MRTYHNGAAYEGIGLQPIGVDRHGPKWRADQVNEFVAREILGGNHLERRAKSMSTDFEKATEIVDAADKMFSASLTSLHATQTRISDEAKKAGGQVRDAANKLMEGLQRIEKTANFDRLERYVTLLERAAVAMEMLAELEKDGKLERIANAVK